MNRSKKNRKGIVGLVVGAIVVVIAIVMLVVSGVTSSNKTEATEEVEQTINVNTTMMNAIDDSFVGEYRIEQMFVESVSTTSDGHYIVILEDTEGYLWELVDVEMYLYDDVLVLLSNNYTDTIVDDEIIHCWIGIE